MVRQIGIEIASGMARSLDVPTVVNQNWSSGLVRFERFLFQLFEARNFFCGSIWGKASWLISPCGHENCIRSIPLGFEAHQVQ